MLSRTTEIGIVSKSPLKTRRFIRMVRELSYKVPCSKWLHRICKMYVDNYYSDNFNYDVSKIMPAGLESVPAYTASLERFENAYYILALRGVSESGVKAL